ncbi:MAG: penicillin-binding transpeptidase domain-containing protein, partial [Cyanobacteria bacterium P01_A01_bin.105]
TPLEMTAAVGAIANQGIWNKGHGIRRVLDSSDCTDPNDWRSCRVIFDFTTSEFANRSVLSQQTASNLTAMMQAAVSGGTATNARIGVNAAGKTGTTNNAVDMWFIGFIPSNQLVTGIWLGNDDNAATRGSSAQAAQIWGEYMREVVR